MLAFFDIKNETMNYEFQQSPLSKAILTSVFIGFSQQLFVLYITLFSVKVQATAQQISLMYLH